MFAMRLPAFGLLGFMLLSLCPAFLGTSGVPDDPAQPSRLMVLWTSGDREVALKMVFMYTLNAKKRGWWDQIRFVIWGPSSKLLSEDRELQEEIRKMEEAGVELLACKACADQYGVSDKLEELRIDVKYMGVPMTEMLKSGWVSLTF